MELNIQFYFYLAKSPTSTYNVVPFEKIEVIIIQLVLYLELFGFNYIMVYMMQICTIRLIIL